MTISINFEQSLPPNLDCDLLERAIQTTLERHDRPDVDVTLQLTDDESMQVLNHAYRGIDATTDVLAFYQAFVDPETDRLYLGDIIISVETAQLQAVENKHSLNKECTLLTVHGTLHLLGYDHHDPQEKDEMWAIQEKILKYLLPYTQEDVE
jgi:probable rRNA maturation factor